MHYVLHLPLFFPLIHTLMCNASASYNLFLLISVCTIALIGHMCVSGIIRVCASTYGRVDDGSGGIMSSSELRQMQGAVLSHSCRQSDRQL